MDDGDDYEEVRRRKAEERRRKRDAERLKRRTKLGSRPATSVSSSTSTPVSVSTSNSVASISRESTISTRNISTLDRFKSSSSSTTTSSSRKRNRPDASRIEKLKEEKRAEEGLRLIQEMYGTKYLNADDLLNSDNDNDGDESRGFSPGIKRSMNKRSLKNIPSRSPATAGGSPVSRGRSNRKEGADADADADVDSYKDWNMGTNMDTKQHATSWKSTSTNKKKGVTDGDDANANLIANRQRKTLPASPIPNKETPSKPFKSLPMWNQNNDSSSDEDLVALARMLQEKKKKSPKERSSSFQQMSCAKRSSLSGSGGSPKYTYDDSSDDDLIKSAKEIQAKRDSMLKQAHDRDDDDASELLGEHVDSDVKRKQSSKKRRDDSDDDEVDVDLVSVVGAYRYSTVHAQMFVKKLQNLIHSINISCQ
jgi:hypothetical protein